MKGGKQKQKRKNLESTPSRKATECKEVNTFICESVFLLKVL